MAAADLKIETLGIWHNAVIIADMARLLANHTTFKLGGEPKYWFAITESQDIPMALAEVRRKNLSWQVLGGGSNTVFAGGEANLAILKMDLKGREIVSEDEEIVLIKVSSGEDWDELVAWTTTQNWSGLEALSAIPGSVGATPVQNVGAYGAEVSQVIEGVEVYDVEDNEFKVLVNKDCVFNYRDSIFKHEPKKYIITAVTYKLSKQAPQLPNYDGLKHLVGHTNLTAQLIRDEVIKIRQSKLLDPKEIANVGSFFKNPIVDLILAENLKKQYPDMPQYPNNDQVKLSAAWLIEQAGLKGYKKGAFAVADKHALVLTHLGGGTPSDLLSIVGEVINRVKEQFGVQLEREPILV